MPTVQVLFPMGGLGTRFAAVGIDTPKPLIHVDGRPMILKALSSFDGLVALAKADGGDRRVSLSLIFIVRDEHERDHKLRTRLEEALAPLVASSGSAVRVSFVMMTHDTRGAAETCLLARDAIDARYPIVIMDCDTYVRSAAFDAALLGMAEAADRGDADTAPGFVSGALVHFTSRAKRYSYALTDPETGFVVRTAEKVPISDKSLIGAYGFATGKLFVSAAEALVAEPIDEAKGIKEYYISLIYNFLLRDGRKIVCVPRDDYASFGTPDELAAYNAGKQSWMDE